MNSQINNEDRVRERRRRLIEEGKRRKRRQLLIRRMIRLLAAPAVGAVLIVMLISGGIRMFHKPSEKPGIKTESSSGENGNEIASGSHTGQPGSGVGGAGAGSGQPGSGVGGAESGSGDSGEPTDGPQDNIMGGNGTGQYGLQGTGTEAAGGVMAGGNAVGGATATGYAGSLGVGVNAPLPAGWKPQVPYSARTASDTQQLGEDIVSSHAIFIDLETATILAQRDAMSRMNPASMTKVLTVLVAAEHVQNLDDTFTITRDITDYSFVNDCSCVGFSVGETVTVRDLFYGTVLPSGADAAAALAIYVAGSMEAFVDMMNEKLDELGLSDTAHFTNCVGIYDKEHYCTAYDMAMIMEAAISNDFCREVLSTHTYTTSKTEQHPDGITISNWFLRRIEDKDTGGQVICGKTGYVLQSGNCAASYGLDAKGKGYVCVTAGASSVWRCIYDHTALYKQFSTEDKTQ